MKTLIKTLKLTSIAAAALAMSGCAMVFSGFNSKVALKSQPSGCSVYDNDGKFIGKTPCKVKMSKKTDYLIFKKPGYAPQTVYTNRHFAWFPLVCDVIFWPSAIVDVCSGACYEINEKYYVIMHHRR